MQSGIDNSAPNAIFFHQRSDTGYLTHPYQITQYVKKLGVPFLSRKPDATYRKGIECITKREYDVKCTGKSFLEARILVSTITNNMTKDCSLNYEFST